MSSLTQQEKNELFDLNVLEINEMDIAAGSLVKNLIMELDRKNRNTYIKLRDAVPNGHVVFFDFVEGDPSLVKRIGIALGFVSYSNSRLEVRNV